MGISSTWLKHSQHSPRSYSGAHYVTTRPNKSRVLHMILREKRNLVWIDLSRPTPTWRRLRKSESTDSLLPTLDARLLFQIRHQIIGKLSIRNAMLLESCGIFVSLSSSWAEVWGGSSGLIGDHDLTPTADDWSNIAMASPSTVSAATTCIQMQGQNGAISSKGATAHSPPNSAPTYLCCSVEDPDEFQVDLCPRKWFCCCSKDGSGFLQIVWQICFVILCLPICYPCYLTRWYLLIAPLRWAQNQLRTGVGEWDGVGGDLMGSWFLLRPHLAVTELALASVQSKSSWLPKSPNSFFQMRPRPESGSQEGWKSQITFSIQMINTQGSIKTSFFL